MRLEPVRILFQAKPGNQNLAYFEPLIAFPKRFLKDLCGGASGI
jgi:hypothetical protein